MKKTISFATLAALSAATLLAAATVAAQAQNWVNVYDPSLGGIVGVCGDIGRDDAGNVYAVGRQIAPDGNSVAIVQGSSDQGATWSALDQYSEAGLSYAHNRAFAADRTNGNLFAGGNLNNLLPDGTYEFDTLWFIRERDPVTGAWSIAEDYSALVNDVGQASCADIMVSPSGDVYATGGGQLGTGLGWLIRKRPAGATAFTTVDVDYSGRSSGSGWDIAFHPTNGVFAVGAVNGLWTVRRSSTGDKGTWSTVDSFYTRREWTSGTAKFILATPSKIHVAGSAYNAGTKKTHWVIRSSADGGLTWSITDNLAPVGGSAEATGIVEDAAGNLVVCGFVTGSAGDSSWIVRKGVAGTKLVKQGKQWVAVPTINWTTTDDYQLVTGKSAQPNGITTDPNGNIYVGGRAQDASGIDQWIVRKLPAQ
jgi:hypothetical protein